MTRWLDQFRPDLAVISQGMSYDGEFWMKACSVRDIPYVLIVNNAREYLWPSDDQCIELGRLFDKAKVCFFVAENNLRMVEKQLAMKLRNAQIVRCPFDVAYDNDIPWPDVSRNMKMACVARLSLDKGQDVLFDVLNMPKWKERSIEMSLYGIGAMRLPLERLKKMRGLNSVKFLGYVDDMESIWRQHHALVLPSRYEGLPIVLVDAMLCGRPCIVTDVGGNAEIIEDNITGFVARAPTPECLDEAMERAWQRRNEWAAMGRLAREHVKKYVSRDPVEIFADQLVTLLR